MKLLDVLVSRTALEMWAETSSDFFQQGWDDFFWSIPAGEASGAASLQIEVTPNIDVETEIGQDAQAGAGVTWSWDY